MPRELRERADVRPTLELGVPPDLLEQRRELATSWAAGNSVVEEDMAAGTKPPTEALEVQP